MTDFMPTTSKERGLRSGTVVVGLGRACELANREKEYDHQHVKRISDMLAQVKMIGGDVMMVMIMMMVIIRIVVIYSWKIATIA